MSVTTDAEAREVMLALATGVDPAGIVGSVGFEFREFGKAAASDKIPVTKFWAHYGVNVQNTPKQTLGPVGRRLFTVKGQVSVLVHAPMSSRDNLTKCVAVATLFRNVYRDGRSSKVWFRNARLNDQPPSEQGQYRVLAQADFEFTERG